MSVCESASLKSRLTPLSINSGDAFASDAALNIAAANSVFVSLRMTSP